MLGKEGAVTLEYLLGFVLNVDTFKLGSSRTREGLSGTEDFLLKNLLLPTRRVETLGMDLVRVPFSSLIEGLGLL